MTSSRRRISRPAALVTLALGAALLQAAPASASGATSMTTKASHQATKAASGDQPPSFVTGQDDPRQTDKSPADKTEVAPPVPADTAKRLRQRVDQPVPRSPHQRPSMLAAKKSAAATNSTKGSAGSTAVAGCSVADFASRTGSALVQQIKSSTTDCVNTLFSVSGSNASSIFNESQMVAVANAFRSNAGSYAGTNTTSTAQLVLFLRAGYYVQYYAPSTVGTYGPAMTSAIQGALDSFFANAHSQDVSDANGETLSEAVTLIDSSEQNARYLNVVKRLLNGYTSAYDASWWMLNAVNNTYTVLFRGHQVPSFVTAVQSDPSVLDTLYNFAATHLSLLGGTQGYLASNAGRELGRFLQDAPLQATVRPKAGGLLAMSSITGTTAPLWVGIAEMTADYDSANCSYYNTCNLPTRLASAVLKSNYTCSSSIRILAQDMTSAQLADSCTSLRGQDAYFHSIVKDNGPVANDNNTTIEVVVFNSSTDYQTYAGAMYGIDTNNGGMYLEGDPAAAGNQPRFVAYEAEWVRPTFQIWNLNHEYTHYLDGRFDMYGDFNAGTTTPTIWWIEGFAEYVSYSYRKVDYTDAMNQAALGTYSLRTLFDTDYTADQTRIYNWGYLAVRFMLERHWSEMNTLLGYYRSGNYAAARTYLTQSIGSSYNGEFSSWLASCAAGACSGGTTPTPPSGNVAPTASFTSTTQGLVANLTDTSTDSDGTIASRAWTFGDGQTSTATNPTVTYAAAGTYTVTLKVTDDQGATNSTSRTIQVTSGGGTSLPECTSSDTRMLGQNCKRSNKSVAAGDQEYLFVYIPAGTTRLTISTTGGSGNADLYYNPSSWATSTDYTQRSTGSGNSHTITVTNPPAGYNYISLVGVTDASGVEVSTKY